MNRSILYIAGASLCLAGCGSNGEGSDAGAAASAPGDATGAPAAAAGLSGSVAYPGAQVTGNSFTTGDSIDRVRDWYFGDEPIKQRDGVLWTVSKPEKRGESYLVHLTIVADDGDGQSYAIYLDPASGGGTTGRIRPITDEELKSGVQL